jgi:RNA polymerase sigma-70 factor, ECF subfamily
MTVNGDLVDAAADERALVARAQQGDRQAFGRIYQDYVDRVYSFVAFRVRDDPLAEDLTQEVFVQALRALPSYDWRGSLAPWLLRIARNTIIDHWRQRARRPERTLTAVEVGDTDEEGDRLERWVSDEAAEAVARAEQVLDRRRLVAAATHLTQLQQQVVALRFASGLSVQETAAAMGRSEGAIKNLQHHALRALRRRLDDEALS